MRKKVITMVCLVAFVLGACGGNKWNCKKRYCETQPAQPIIETNAEVCVQP